MSNNSIELVFVPPPVMGHLLSTVEVAKRLIQRDPRIFISIYIINLPNRSNKLIAYLSSQSRDNPYPTRLIFATLPPLSNPPDPSTPNFFRTILELYKPLVKQAVEERTQSGLPRPGGFVLDMFCTTMIDVANELHVPSYIFFTSGISLLSLMFHAQSLVDDKGVDMLTEFNDPNGEVTVPGFKNKMSTKFVPAGFQDKESGFNTILNHARRFRKTKGILVNTYAELESSCVQALLDKKNPAIYTVGPILDLDSASRDNMTRREDKESIIKWLDEQPESSVVFLCFGSMGSFDEDQVKEIANGLDRSGHRFLWSLRKPISKRTTGAPSENETFEEALPEGFMDRTAERGKIIGWAPQISILAHPAVGGFVSHCGWNSTLESLWFGVPIATWPLYAEQQLNAFELVKELGLGVEIRMDYKRDWKDSRENFRVKAEEIENGIKKLMSMDKEIRRRVMEIKDKARKTLEVGGSSYDCLGRFIEHVSHNIVA